MTNSNGRAVDGRKLLVASKSFSLERGGAARVGRLLARLAADIGLDADLLALSDQEPIRDFNLSSRTAAGSRADFAFRCWTNGITRSHFIYNHVGMARAHCLLPMLRRPYAVWMLGIDVWSPRMLGDYGQRIEEASLLLSISDFTRRRAVEFLPSAQRAKVCWLATEENEPSRGVKRFRRSSHRSDPGAGRRVRDAERAYRTDRLLAQRHGRDTGCAAADRRRRRWPGHIACSGGRVRGGKQYRVHELSAPRRD